MTRDEYKKHIEKVEEKYCELVENAIRFNSAEGLLVYLLYLEIAKAKYELEKESDRQKVGGDDDKP